MTSFSEPLTNPMAPLSRLLNSTLTVIDIVRTPLWSVPETMPVEDALKAMSNQNFDIGGITPEPTRRYVHRSFLERALYEGLSGEPVSLHAVNISASECIEKSLPVAALLEIFELHERLFVLDGNVVRWVITHADLVAPAVSVAVLSYLTVIEAGLKQLNSDKSDEEIEALLPKNRRERVRVVFGQRLASNVETSLRDCIFLEDWLTVTRKTPSLYRQLGFESGEQLKEATSSFGIVRNDLAHGRDLLSNLGESVLHILARIRRIREFSAAVWRAVDFTRSSWDQYAQTVISTLDVEPKILSGPDAVTEWDFSTDSFVLTAWNPGSIWVSLERNTLANERLRESLEKRGAVVTAVVGRSAHHDWVEESYLIEGLQEWQIAELGSLFGQAAYFKLDSETLQVCDTHSMTPVRTVERRNAAIEVVSSEH